MVQELIFHLIQVEIILCLMNLCQFINARIKKKNFIDQKTKKRTYKDAV